MAFATFFIVKTVPLLGAYEIYIGIRDFDNNKMIVNFYPYGVETIDQYGTTVETNRNFSISKLKKIDGYL